MVGTGLNEGPVLSWCSIKLVPAIKLKKSFLYDNYIEAGMGVLTYKQINILASIFY